MPVFFQQQINETTRLGIWKIEESEEFFKDNVPLHRDVTHPHKRLQHLAGRFLLRFLFPDFPNDLIQIADTKKPFLPDSAFKFSISQCGDYAAAIVSRIFNVGIDIEIPVDTIGKIKNKFLSEREQHAFDVHDEVENFEQLTVLWSAKEAVFKWYGFGSVDFKKHIRLEKMAIEKNEIICNFQKTQQNLSIKYQTFPHLTLAYLATNNGETI